MSSMFKSILPLKRVVSSSDFTMVTPLGESDVNGKENVFMNNTSSAFANTTNANNKNNNKNSVRQQGTTTAASTMARPFQAAVGSDKRKKAKGKSAAAAAMEEPDMIQAFDKLLDDLQIPPSTRQKLYTMEPAVKAEMLRSSQFVHPQRNNNNNTTSSPARSSLRRTQSTQSFTSSQLALDEDDDVLGLPQPSFLGGGGQVSALHTPRKASAHARGMSIGGSPGSPSGVKSRSQVHLPSTASSSVLDLAGGKPATFSKAASPVKIISALSGTSSLQIDVENIKKLRLLLRNESAEWTKEFLRQGGYTALLTRLNELLEVEWREEQHDDQVLHEILRCFKALSTSSIGCGALRSSGSAPFAQLVSLLYSDKKPGDVNTRQLITELIHVLFDVYPPGSLPASTHTQSRRREAWESSDDLVGGGASRVVTLPAPHKSFFSFIRALLLTTPPPSAEAPETAVAPHDFIESLHTPRVYKAYLQELSDVCRDYFWVFCHPNNTLWILNEVDEGKVERPRAPGGMTGGVEFEAMGYFTTHLRLLNAIAASAAQLNLPEAHELSAHSFHRDLFLSGLERIILISRKASTTYYPTLHLELARYMAHAQRAGYEMPWTVGRLMGMPPTAMCRAAGPAPPSASSSGGKRSTPVGMLG